MPIRPAGGTTTPDLGAIRRVWRRVSAAMGRLFRSTSSTWAIIVIIGVLTAVTAVVVADFRERADAARVQEARLQRLRLYLERIEVGTWRMRADPAHLPANTAAVERALARTASFVEQCTSCHPPERPFVREFAVELSAYRRAVGEQIHALVAGDMNTAIKIDEERVGPSSERLHAQIVSAVDAQARHTALVNRRTARYITAAVVGSGAVSMLLFLVLHRTSSRFEELRRAQRTLRAQEERYRRLFQEHPDAVYVTGEDGRIIDANRAAVKLTGRSRTALLSTRFSEFVDADDRGTAIPPPTFDAAPHGEQPLKVLRATGETAECLAWATVRHDDDGRPAGWQIFVRDVTERNLLQRQFEEAQKMEVVGRLAGGVAHDFNNLLTVILGHTDFLLRRLPDDDPSRADAAEIRSAGAAAASLTQQLLAFSRKQILRPEVVDINIVVSDSARMLERLIGVNIGVRLVLAASLHAVRIDRSKLEQVILNLAVNARDAMPEGGALTIETANVVLDADYARAHPPVVPGRHVMIAVSDTGVGMTPEVQAHLFEPFFTTKGVGKGTGLGLATVYGVVRQCEGHIFVQSEPGRGATFRIYFPAVDAKAAVAPRETPTPVVGGTGHETILLVEDNNGLRALGQRALGREGYTVITASAGEEALQLCPPGVSLDLLVTDMVMPGMDGRALASQLRRSRPSLKVLYMSGYTEDVGFRQGGLEREASFLQKPFGPGDLVQRVREMLGAGAMPDSGGGGATPVGERGLIE